MTTITVVTLDETMGNIRFNTPNQLKALFGKYTEIFIALDCGTVRDEDGKAWDYFQTEEVLEGGFKKLRVFPAQ